MWEELTQTAPSSLKHRIDTNATFSNLVFPATPVEALPVSIKVSQAQPLSQQGSMRQHEAKMEMSQVS